MVPDELTGGPRFAAFCERYIRQTKGRWGGSPLTLEPWQREFWWEALELDPITGLRIYTEVGLGIPRKNGKSTQASAAGLYFLTADGENEPEVLAAAAAKNQAGIVMGQSRSMALRSPRLLDHVIPRKYHIECPKNGGIMRAVSSLANLQHGFNPSANIVDELHAHRTDELFTALTTGTGAREQPFTLWISTGGDDTGPLGDQYRSMLEGPGDLERRGSLLIYRDRVNGVLIFWYGAARDADIEDPKVWLACNPASWLHDGKVLTREFGKLKARGALLAWRMYHLNQFAGMEGSWLPEGAWGRTLEPDLPLNVGLPIGAGVFKTADSSGATIAIAQRQGDRVVLRAEVFSAEPETGRVSTLRMRARLRELRGTYPLPQVRDEKTKRPIPGPAVAFDRWSFQESAGELDQEGLNMVDFPQIASTMGPASTQAYELVTTGRLAHIEDPVLELHFGNTNAVLTDRGMRAMPRRDGPQVNHAAIASIMAVAMCMQEAPKPFVAKPRVGVGF